MEKKTIVFFGDSLTQMNMDISPDSDWKFGKAMGEGYVTYVSGILSNKYPEKFRYINAGIGGHKSVDLYARIKHDVWQYCPDYLSIFVGINDVLREVNPDFNDGVDDERFEWVYDMMISETLKRFENIKIILVEPIILHASRFSDEEYQARRDGAERKSAIIAKLADKYNLPYVRLQGKFDELASMYGADILLGDGVHTGPAGVYAIGQEWLKTFEEVLV